MPLIDSVGQFPSDIAYFGNVVPKTRLPENKAMSMRPELIHLIPKETARVAKAAFPKGNVYMKMRDELGAIFEDEDFACFSPPVVIRRLHRGGWLW